MIVEVQTEALGLSANEVEQLITLTLEQDLFNGIAWVDEIWSSSMPGLSSIILIFKPGTDPMEARQMVSERLTQAHALPNVSTPPVMLQPYSSTRRAMIVGLSTVSKEMSLIDMSVLTRWTIQPYLMGLEGVANVSIWGQRKRQLQVHVHPDSLRKKSVTLDEIVKTTGEALWVSPLSYLNSSTPGTGGFIETPNQRLGIRHVSPISNPEDLANIPLVGHNMTLGEVTNVVENHQPLIGDAIINGEPGLLLVIEKFSWASSSKITEKVEDALEKLKPGLSGIIFDTEIYQPAKYIESSLLHLGYVVIIGILLLVALLFLWFYNWRTAFISLITILFSLFSCLYFMSLQGFSINNMVIVGLIMSLGLLINDAINSVENGVGKMVDDRSSKPHQSMVSLVAKAISETRNYSFTATLICLLIASPFFFVDGKLGAILHPMILAFVASFIISGLICMTLTPALLITLNKASGNSSPSPIVSNMTHLYSKFLKKIIENSVLVFGISFLIVILSIISVPFLQRGPWMPDPIEHDLKIELETMAGTAHPEMARITTNIMKELRAIPGVENIAAHIGRAIMSDEIVNVNTGEVWISLDDDIDYKHTLTNIKEVINGYPGIKHQTISYRSQMLKEPKRLSDPIYAIRVYGENQRTLELLAEEIGQSISKIHNIQDVFIEYPTKEPVIEIEVDIDKARMFGIKPGDVRRTAAIFMGGIKTGSLFEKQKVFSVLVWGTPETRQDLTKLKELLIDTPDGGHVRLEEVAEVRISSNPVTIKREGVSRYLDVQFNYEGSNSATLSEGINETLANMDFPLEFHAELVGRYSELESSRNRFINHILAALLGILLLMQAVFLSWRLAIAVFIGFILPLSCGVLAMFIFDVPISIGSLSGFLAILGLTVYQGVLLIKRLRHLELQEGKTLNIDLIKKVVLDRFNPIVLTILLFGLTIVPILIFGNISGMEILYPMSLVIIGGLIGLGLLNLFVLPILYFKFGKISESVLKEEKAMLE